MKKEINSYIEDIRFSILRIELHIKDIESFKIFKTSYTVYDAVERRLAIIGEAMWQINKIEPKINFTGKEKIIGLRHILTHDYDLVSPEIIWKILENNIPILKQEIDEQQKK
ncbi:MAG: HepT-like ribonuclease domain-containing protein [Ferruginibacter sp.]